MKMATEDRKHIALISVHGDPAVEIGKEEAGGQNVYVRQVGEALAKRGWTVDLFTRKSHRDDREIVEHAPNCRTIRLVAGPEEFIPRNDIFDDLPTFVEEFVKFQEREGIHYPVIHTNYWLSAWVGMELKKYQPLVQLHTYHSLGAVKYQAVEAIPAIATTRLNVEKTCLETAECIVATSPQECEHMRSLVSERGTIEIIPCGTDIRRFRAMSKAEARNQLGLEQDRNIAFYIGRFDRRKGIETLVRAIAQTQIRAQGNLQLIIGGGSRPGHSDGIERDRIEGIVNELGLSEITTFPGRISDELLPVYYAAADVSVVPSHYEPFGLVAIEAMASGTPVIASDVGGLQFTVKSEETGLLCPPKDDGAFAEAIDRILGDREWRDRLGQAARARVEAKFSWDGVASQLSDLYNRVLAEKTAPVTLKASA
ncbi:glycosyltransferase family 1 protein [Oxynema aestuarii AP17]|uniref:Glycosyltransferase family 1 protein n=2 Tax=Oxynema TaxID=1492710 RepID=A0A6H1U1D2_9CYAN|nr:glycosyltransferase family 1 protein [Oxynema aestuarii AP17]